MEKIIYQYYLFSIFSVKKIAHAIADGAEDVGISKNKNCPKVSAKNENEANIPETGEVYCTKDDLIGCSGLAQAHLLDLDQWLS